MIIGENTQIEGSLEIWTSASITSAGVGSFQYLNTGVSGLRFPNDAYGGGGDTAGMRLASRGGEATSLELYVTNDAGADWINLSVPSINDAKVNGYTIWNAGNLTEATISNWNTSYNRVISSNLAVNCFQGNDSDSWLTRMNARGNHFGRYDNAGNGSPRNLNYLMLRETQGTVYGIIGHSTDNGGEWYVGRADYTQEITNYYKLWTTNNFNHTNYSLTSHNHNVKDLSWSSDRYDDILNHVKNGITDSPTGNDGVFGSWAYHFKMLHSANPNDWQFLLAADFYSDSVVFRRKAEGSWQAPQYLWHSGNFSQTNINNWNTAYTNNHTHSNKANLDSINQNLGTTSHPSFSDVTTPGAAYVRYGYFGTHSGWVNGTYALRVYGESLLLGNTTLDTNYQIFVQKDITPTTATNNNYSLAPIVINRATQDSSTTTVAGIGFHNAGVNAATLYYDTVTSVFKYNRNISGPLVTIWDDSNLNVTPSHLTGTTSNIQTQINNIQSNVTTNVISVASNTGLTSTGNHLSATIPANTISQTVPTQVKVVGEIGANYVGGSATIEIEFGGNNVFSHTLTASGQNEDDVFEIDFGIRYAGSSTMEAYGLCKIDNLVVTTQTPKMRYVSSYWTGVPTNAYSFVVKSTISGTAGASVTLVKVTKG